MEKSVRKATEEIIGKDPAPDRDMSELTKCAIEIANIALTAFADELRDKALNVAKAIADFDTELERLRQI